MYFPSTTEIYRALMGKKGPYAYVPKLYKALLKLNKNPTQANLDAAKKITSNPTIHNLLAAMYESRTYISSFEDDYDDTSNDILYGIIAPLVKDEYKYLPSMLLISEIYFDDKLRYDVLSFYETKYTNPDYIKKFDAEPINKKAVMDELARTIIQIELDKLSNDTTSDAEIRTILGNLHQTMKLPRFKKEKAVLLAFIFNILEAKIKKELSRPNPSETKIDTVYCLYAREFADLFDDKNMAFEIQEKFNSHRIMLNHKRTSGQPVSQDAYDKLKQKFGHAIKKVKKKANEISEKPGVKKAKKQTGDALESAARTTVNAIDAGIQKLKKKATRENLDSAINSIKKKWDEFMAQIESEQKKQSRI